MNIPLTDLQVQYSLIKDEIDAAIQRVLQQSQFILGPEVSAFEAEMASYCGTKFAVGVASGTDALHLALLACGVEPGDEVILYVGEVAYRYAVEEKLILPDKYVSIEQKRENGKWIRYFPDERLTLVTCWPYTNNTHRVIVIAKPLLDEG